MANRISLQALNHNYEDDGIYIAETSNIYPILWAALFTPEDLIIENEDEIDWRILRAETKIALNRFNSRLPALKDCFPKEVWPYFKKWQILISSIMHHYIQVNIEEYAGFFSDEEFLEELKRICLFDRDALVHMIKECSLDQDLEGGLSGYIEDEYTWHQEYDLALVENHDGSYLIQLKSSNPENEIQNNFDKKNDPSLENTPNTISSILPKNTALEYIVNQSNCNEVDHQYLLGMMYLFGCVVQKDINKCIEYLQKSANRGHIEASFELANLYYEGVDIEQDFELAYSWFKIAADDDHKIACYLLSTMIREGIYAPKNDEEYINYLKKSASLGYKEAQSDLGLN